MQCGMSSTRREVKKVSVVSVVNVVNVERIIEKRRGNERIKKH